MFRTVCGRICVALLFLVGSLGVGQQRQGSSADAVWTRLIAGNQRFLNGKPASRDPTVERKALTNTQHPQVAVLSCSDSRVPSEYVFDAGLGDLFVVRSAGEDDDPISIGSLEYAVEHLGSTVIVVMGHQRCGAVTAACSAGKGESANFEAMIAPILPSCSKTDRAQPHEFDLAIRDHIHRVAQDILAKSELLRKSSAEGKLTVIEAYYSLDSGEVTRLR